MSFLPPFLSERFFHQTLWLIEDHGRGCPSPGLDGVHTPPHPRIFFPNSLKQTFLFIYGIFSPIAVRHSRDTNVEINCDSTTFLELGDYATANNIFEKELGVKRLIFVFLFECFLFCFNFNEKNVPCNNSNLTNPTHPQIQTSYVDFKIGCCVVLALTVKNLNQTRLLKYN